MTIIWLIVWAFQGFPAVEFWNTWAVALAVMAGVDILGVIRRSHS